MQQQPHPPCTSFCEQPAAQGAPVHKGSAELGKVGPRTVRTEAEPGFFGHIFSEPASSSFARWQDGMEEGKRLAITIVIVRDDSVGVM
jgi:hypothetical protein